MPRGQAERFSLLMSLPVTAGAAALTLLRADRARLRALAGPLGVGAPAAAVAGCTSTRLLLRRGDSCSRPPPLYRLGLAAVVLTTSRRRRDRP